MENEVEELPGCMCEYIPVELKERIERLAENAEAYTAQVVTVALEMGLALLNHQCGLNKPEPNRGDMKMRKVRKSKLSGAGI